MLADSLGARAIGNDWIAEARSASIAATSRPSPLARSNDTRLETLGSQEPGASPMAEAIGCDTSWRCYGSRRRLVASPATPPVSSSSVPGSGTTLDQ
jgi:hypothetical protein